jgi:hypothetical protein
MRRSISALSLPLRYLAKSSDAEEKRRKCCSAPHWIMGLVSMAELRDAARNVELGIVVLDVLRPATA